MSRHQFSRGVKCGHCGKVVSTVEAHTWEAANNGEGICDECTIGGPDVDPVDRLDRSDSGVGESSREHEAGTSEHDTGTL